jgi:hypothetical protein
LLCGWWGTKWKLEEVGKLLSAPIDETPQKLGRATEDSNSEQERGVEGPIDTGKPEEALMEDTLGHASVRTKPKPAGGEVDGVEQALADAVTRAARAGEWGVVAQLAKELEARRLARLRNVLPLDAKSRKGA